VANIFVIFLLLIPFVIFHNTYEGPKVFLFLITGLLLAVFWIFRIIVKKQIFKLGKVDYFFLTWLLILLVSSIFGIHPIESIVGGSYRHQGVLFFLTFWLVAKTVEILNKKQKIFLSKTIGFAILAESLIVFFQFMTEHLYFGKPLGTIGEANAVAGFLAIGFPFVYENFDNVFFAIPIISILITESRSGLLAIVPNFYPLINQLKGWIKKFSLMTVMVLTILFLVFVSSEKGNSPFENRPLIWKLGFQQIMSRPVLGFGAESGEVIYNKAFSNYNLPLDNLVIDRAHNLFLDVAMWSGIVGLIFFSLFLFEKFKTVNGKVRKLAFTSFLIYSMFQPLSIVHWLLFFLL
jgi:O-antigen ligase